MVGLTKSMVWGTNPALWSDSDFDGYADQRGDPLESDDCPNEYGKSTIFYLGCPDMDNDGWPDMKEEIPMVMGTWIPQTDANPLQIHLILCRPIGCRWKLFADHEKPVEKSTIEDQSFRALSLCWQRSSNHTHHGVDIVFPRSRKAARV
ncbi:MAG: hypothetical protein Ct9H90mP16_13300 [Candidatus Poseidoniales archaeon]|nr:MAG: hypothetical protein Ct9H90mP16_13300 [Candidatus Poseidoniales archaeon]